MIKVLALFGFSCEGYKGNEVNPTITLSQRVSRLLALLLVGAFCIGWIPACLSPCDQLAQNMCTDMKKYGTPELCLLAQQEFRQAHDNFRRCQALATQWLQSGRSQLQEILAKYKHNRSLILNMKLKVGEVRREQEYRRFRETLRHMLNKPWQVTSPSPPKTSNNPPSSKTPSRPRPTQDDDDD